jgi:hypothetical protein
VGRKKFAQRCSFRSDKACRGVLFGEATVKTEALAKTGRPYKKSLL